MATKRAATSSPNAARAVYVALLRGINVGGKNRLAMTDLTAAFAEAGCADARTYIQSGNVVFRAPPRAAQRVPSVVAELVAERHGVTSPVIVRSAAELAEAVARNPFLRAGADPTTLHVAFLADTPTPTQVAALDPARSPGDSFEVRGREVYLHFPNGVAATKLTNAYLDSKLATVSTVRNWRTVLKLLEMTQ